MIFLFWRAARPAPCWRRYGLGGRQIPGVRVTAGHCALVTMAALGRVRTSCQAVAELASSTQREADVAERVEKSGRLAWDKAGRVVFLYDQRAWAWVGRQRRPVHHWRIQPPRIGEPRATTGWSRRCCRWDGVRQARARRNAAGDDGEADQLHRLVRRRAEAVIPLVLLSEQPGEVGRKGTVRQADLDFARLPDV